MSYSVYKHTFPNGKVYIGITSRKPELRWRKNGNGYLFKDKNGEYTQYLMANAIQKYGWNNINHEILFTGLTKDEAENKEIELIAYYKSNQKEFGYNIQNGGNTYGTHSEEVKKKIGEANKKRIWKEESRTKLSEAMKGKKHLQKKTEIFKYAILKANKNRVWKEESKNKIADAHKKSVICIETNIIYESIKEAKNKTGINHISEACNGKQKTAGGYHWQYIEKED